MDQRAPWLPLETPAGPAWLNQQAGDTPWLFYAPSLLAVVPRAEAGRFRSALERGDGTLPAAGVLLEQIQRAGQQWDGLFSGAFSPACLTIYLSHACNLKCSYCYATASAHAANRLNLAAVQAGCDWTAQACRQAGRPLTVVFHGGGEPTFDWAALQTAVGLVDACARRWGLACFKYIATNGVMSAARMAWIAQNFNLVGLSCDGPAWIHNRQRARRSGAGSLAAVLRSAHILRQAGTPYHVRVTITPQSSPHQQEIAEFICSQLAPQEIHVEPVYAGGRQAPADGFQAPALAAVNTTETAASVATAAGAFCQHYLLARATAARAGCVWRFSGARPWEVHGPNCHILRGVLNLLPDGSVSACFKGKSRRETGQWAIGGFDEPGAQVQVDLERVQTMAAGLKRSLAGCQGCFNRWHCSRDCPERCLLDEPQAAPLQDTFRCLVQQKLASALLFEQAGKLLEQVSSLPQASRQAGGIVVAPVTAG